MRPRDTDVVAQIVINLYGNGEMGIAGNIGDKTLALGMLDHARDAIAHQLRPEDMKPAIVIPNRDVVVAHHPNYPVRANGDSGE